MKRTIRSRRPERNRIALICSSSRDSSPRFRKSDRATRLAASQLLETCGGHLGWAAPAIANLEDTATANDPVCALQPRSGHVRNSFAGRFILR